jgi:acetyl-CoA acyltransferase 1
MLAKGVREKSGLDPALVEEIIVGNVLHKDVSWISRASAIAAGFPPSTATSTVSRWCSSGLLAVQAIANQITAGSIDIGIAVGAESMSTTPDKGSPPLPEALLKDSNSRDIREPMGWTSENVARDFNISRDTQDEFAAASQQKAERAKREGWTATEILPMFVEWRNPETNQAEQVLVDKDDGVRYGTTLQGLSKIRGAFPQWPPATTTGGNASQITDGAAALLLMRRDVAERLGQPILGKFVASTVVGLAPRIMGIGPTLAIPKLLGKLGIAQEDVDVFEINEAFASMVRSPFQINDFCASQTHF